MFSSSRRSRPTTDPAPGTSRQYEIAGPGATGTVLTVLAVALIAFLLYDATLLQGQDLGDTASFQATIWDRFLTPRQGYPLYYAVGDLFVWLAPGNPARALNLASAVCGAIACGLLAWIVAALADSLAAGAFAGLLYAASYTFWSQAIIAEVYALHALMTAACLVALILWASKPTLARLAVFFLLYAVGFGNHLSMVLLMPGFTLFLLWAARGGPLAMVRPRVVLLALAMAALGASLYLWNLSYLWHDHGRPPGLFNLVATFWFDVTKADWRASMVLGTAPRTNVIRAAMYWFDLRQQFGLPGIALAVIGACTLAWRRPAYGTMLFTLYAVNWAFAFTYNVGDTHVFYLPSHLMVALAAGYGVAMVGALAAALVPVGRLSSPISRLRPAALVASLLVLYPAWRAVDTLPALDRSGDHDAKMFFDRFTAGLTGQNAVLASELNWQLQNGLDYYGKYTKPDLIHFASTETVLHFPFLVRDNLEIGRDVVLTAGSVPPVAAAYGGLFWIEPDVRLPVVPLRQRVGNLPRGTLYVLTLLAPYDDFPLDPADLRETVRWLSGGTVSAVDGRLFNLVCGRIGQKPVLIRSDDEPFRVKESIGRLQLDVRMEAWLPADTIRRMGFGAVIVNRRHQQTIDRGVSFVALADDGRVLQREYAAALFAPQPRYLVRVIPPAPGE
jgi:hypothetical protein